MVHLETVNWKVLWGTKNGSCMASLQKHPFKAFIFKNVLYDFRNPHSHMDYFMVILHPFWSLKASVPIHCNCME